MNWIDLIVSIVTSKVLWTIIALIVFIFAYIKFKVWNFKRKFGCSDTENFIFIARNVSEYRYEIRYPKVFDMNTNICLSNMFKKQDAVLVLPFKIILPIFNEKPKLVLNQYEPCVVEEINNYHLVYKFVGDFYCWREDTSEFVKYECVPMGKLYFVDPCIGHENLKKGDEFRFVVDEGKIAIKKVQKML